MKKRLMAGLVAGGLMAGMLPGVVAAGATTPGFLPNPNPGYGRINFCSGSGGEPITPQ